jgi:surfeit locus 1 family protein
MALIIRCPGGVFRPRLGFSLFVLFGTLFLLGLGGWQMQRMDWKHALIAKITQRMAEEPLPLPLAPEDPAVFDYRRVTVSGTFHHAHEILLAARDVRYSVYGVQVLTPLETPDGQFVLVSRGWVPNDKKVAATRASGQPIGVVTVTGIARVPRARGWLMPDNSPNRNFWLWIDLPAMAKFAAVPGFAPLLVEADNTPNIGGYPVGGQTRVSFTDNHGAYAIIWFALALALLVIGAVKAWEPERKENG